MKKIFVLLFATIFLTSCSIQEKMVVKENLQAEYSLGFDMSSLLKMGDKEKSNEKSKKDMKIIDSVFTVKSMLASLPPDSLAKLTKEQKESMKLFDFFNFKIKINEPKKEMNYSVGLNLDFANGEADLPNSKAIGEFLLKNDKTGAGFGSILDKAKKDKKIEEETKYTYFYDGKIFKRIADKPKTKKPKKENSSKESKKSKKEELKGFEAFGADLEKLFKENNYKMEYTFPKAIKSTNVKGAVISADRKTFTLAVPFENMDDFQDADFEVIFE